MLLSSENTATTPITNNFYDTQTAVFEDQALYLATSLSSSLFSDFNIESASVPPCSESSSRSGSFHLPNEPGPLTNEIIRYPQVASWAPSFASATFNSRADQTNGHASTSCQAETPCLELSDLLENELCGHVSYKSPPASPSGHSLDKASQAKKSHSAVERRYRENLNGRVEQLAQALRATESSSLSDRHKRQCKSDVLNGAIKYISHSEVEMRHMADEIRQLNKRVQAFQELLNYGRFSTEQ